MLPAACLGAEPDAGKELENYRETLAGHQVHFDMVAVPGGVAMLPDGEGGHRKAEVKPFWIGKTETRWDEFGIFALGRDMEPLAFDHAIAAASRPSRVYGVIDRGFGFQGNPAIGMTFQTAELYCEWLSEKTGHTYRLPTLAEWLLAVQEESGKPARAPADLDRSAWHRGNAEGAPRPVGQLQPNARGLHDLLGNVAEWVVDKDGEPVAVGGAFVDEPADVHPFARRKRTPAWQASDPQFPPSDWWLTDAPFVGFRVVREP